MPATSRHWVVAIVTAAIAGAGLYWLLDRPALALAAAVTWGALRD